jgi:hypothetical protein
LHIESLSLFTIPINSPFSSFKSDTFSSKFEILSNFLFLHLDAANPSLATPTPSGGYQFLTTVTAEQELYVRGFEEALKNKHESAQQHTFPGTSSTGSNTPAQILAIEKATAAYKQQQQQQPMQPPMAGYPTPGDRNADGIPDHLQYPAAAPPVAPVPGYPTPGDLNADGIPDHLQQPSYPPAPYPPM